MWRGGTNHGHTNTSFICSYRNHLKLNADKASAAKPCPSPQKLVASAHPFIKVINACQVNDSASFNRTPFLMDGTKIEIKSKASTLQPQPAHIDYDRLDIPLHLYTEEPTTQFLNYPQAGTAETQPEAKSLMNIPSSLTIKSESNDVSFDLRHNLTSKPAQAKLKLAQKKASINTLEKETNNSPPRSGKQTKKSTQAS